MKTQIFYGGWILTLLATIVAIYGAKLTIETLWLPLFFLFYAVCTFSLFRNPTFPKRAAGLATSWMGPLLITVAIIAYTSYFQPTIQALSNQPSPSETTVTSMNNTLIVQIFLGGCVNALLVYWELYGYGFVPMSALGVILIPHKSEKFKRDIEKYPSRWGWIAILIVLLSGWVPGFFLIRFNREFHRDMAETKLMMQQSHERPEQAPALQK